MELSKSSVKFGRLYLLEIRNYLTNQKSLISELDVEVEFFKSYDLNKQQNIGRITIFNVSEQTYLEIGQELNDVFFYCGYGSSLARLESENLLFVATITGVRRDYNDVDKKVILDVSANFREFNFNRITLSARDISPQLLLARVCELGGKSFSLSMANIPKEEQSKFVEYFETYALFSINLNTNFDTALSNVCKMLSLRIVGDLDSDTIRFEINENALPRYIETINKGYRKIGQEIANNVFGYKAVYEKDDKSKEAVIISDETGLQGYPTIERKVVSIPESWSINKNESQTYDSKVAQQNRAVKDAERQAKYDERVKKAEEDGKKTPKPLKPRKQGTKRVKRTYVRVKAYIDTRVKPNSQIILKSSLSELNSIYRVRTAHYKFSTNSESFMDLYCEDTNDALSTLATEQEAIAQGEYEEYSEDIIINDSDDTPSE